MGTILFGIGLERVKKFLSQNKAEGIFFEDEVFDSNYFSSKHKGGLFSKIKFSKTSSSFIFKISGELQWTDNMVGES